MRFETNDTNPTHGLMGGIIYESPPLAKSRLPRAEFCMWDDVQPLAISRLSVMPYQTGWAKEMVSPSVTAVVSIPRRWNSSMSAWS